MLYLLVEYAASGWVRPQAGLCLGLILSTSIFETSGIAKGGLDSATITLDASDGVILSTSISETRGIAKGSTTSLP